MESDAAVVAAAPAVINASLMSERKAFNCLLGCSVSNVVDVDAVAFVDGVNVGAVAFNTVVGVVFGGRFVGSFPTVVFAAIDSVAVAVVVASVADVETVERAIALAITFEGINDVGVITCISLPSVVRIVVVVNGRLDVVWFGLIVGSVGFSCGSSPFLSFISIVRIK